MKQRVTAPAPKMALFLGILALLARVSCVVLLRHDNPIQGADPAEYLALAQNIRFHGVFSFGGPHPWGYAPPLNGHGPFLPTAARAPLYPLLIAGLWWSNAPPILEIQVVQVMLGTIVCLLTYAIALKVADARVAFLAGLFTALTPLSCFITADVMSETLFTFLLISGLWCWGEAKGLAAGLALGAAALTRPIVLPFVILVGLCAVIFKFNRRMHAKIALGALLIVAPWTLRNAVTQHALVPIQTQGWGANLLLGTVNVPYGAHSNQWLNFLADPAFHAIRSSAKTETGAEKEMLHAALERIRADPAGWLEIRLKEFPRLFADSGMEFVPFIPLKPWIIKLAMVACSFLFIAISGLGLIWAWKDWRRFYFLAAFPIFMCLVQFPAYGEPRFLLPVFPAFAIFAAIPLSRLSWRWRSDRSLARKVSQTHMG